MSSTRLVRSSGNRSEHGLQAAARADGKVPPRIASILAIDARNGA